MSARYWKVTDVQGRACHGGAYQYDIPTWDGVEWTPGAWTDRIAKAVPCRTGWHLCQDAHLVHWLHERIWCVEIHPDAVTTTLDNKCVTTGPIRLVAGTPWDATAARLFAVQSAARVLHLATDPRVGEALDVAFRFALGDADLQELDAAGAAAWAAAWAAAGAAARAAAGAAARAAARAAAGDAAGDAAGAAAWAAAGDAARVEQTADLLEWLEVAP